jgi:hypothetical protein
MCSSPVTAELRLADLGRVPKPNCDAAVRRHQKDIAHREAYMVTDIAGSVTAAGVVIGLFGLRRGYRSRPRQFESMYVQRYWSIMDRISLDDPSNAAKPDQADERAIRAYLLLCEGELRIRKQGYIADATYEIWARWMRSQLGHPMFAAVWNRGTGESSFPYKHLKPLYDSGGRYDPLRGGRVLRWLRGLSGTNWV